MRAGHFKVSVGSDAGRSHKTVSTNHNLFEEKGEPKRYRTEVLPLQYQPNALPLGQTGSQTVCAEVKDPSVENPELTNVLPFKPGIDQNIARDFFSFS